jgi:hypothetical protein
VLHRVQAPGVGVGREALDRHDPSAFGIARRKQARAYRPTVQVHRAGAAEPAAAAVLGAAQTEVIAQERDQRGLPPLVRKRHAGAVDLEHGTASWPRSEALARIS